MLSFLANRKNILGLVMLGVFVFMLSVQWMDSSFAGGTNSIFARMDHMVNQLEKKQQLSEAEIQDWRDTIKTLRDKVDQRIKEKEGMNNWDDKDLFDEINTHGSRLFQLYQENGNTIP